MGYHLTRLSAVASGAAARAWLCGASFVHSALPGHFSGFVREAVEPAWHRRLRRKRQASRARIKQWARSTLGKRVRRRVRVAVGFLQAHHTWNPLELPHPIRKCLQMTWYCQTCQVQNTQKLEYCKVCQQHWSRVWTAPTKRRSRSKSSSAKKKEKEAQAGQQADQWRVFPEKAPWIPSTPMTRVGTKSADTPLGGQSREAALGPAQLNLPPGQPKEDVFSDEDRKMLAHLRGLKEMSVELPTALVAQMGLLEEKEKISLSARALSHGHLNKLTKIKTQIATQGKKIETLDTEWTGFVQHTLEKISQHAELYQKCRGELLESYNMKLEELRILKQELNQASRALLEQHTEEPAMPEEANLESQMAAIRASIATQGTVAPIVDLEEDDVMEIPESQDEEVQIAEKDSKATAKRCEGAFRGAASPQKVAQLHLKTKKEKDKQDKP